MYINSINNNGTDYTLSSFGNIIVCSNDINDVKTVTFPNGFVNTNPEPYLTFQVLFVNGHNCVDSTTYMTLNDYNIMVNKNGSLINLPIHEFTESNNVVYKSLQANTILNLFFDGTQFVVIGNPIVLSSTDYIIYANGKVGDGNVGDIKASSLAKIPYGWLECNGQAVLRSTYSELFTKFSTQLYDQTHTLLSRYGEGDGLTTFNLPDYRECALIGVGTNGTNTIKAHDVYTVGEFKDDQFQGHAHKAPIVSTDKYLYAGGGIPDWYGKGTFIAGYVAEPTSDNINGTPRIGTTTHGKQIGITYIIKAL